MLPLAAKGYFVLAPDQRGYGRTTGQDISYDTDLAPFRLSNLVLDALCLVHAFNYTKARAVIGHDFGSPVAAHCSLIRPDVFPALVLMSAPFGGVADIPMGTAEGPQKPLAKSGFKMPSHFTDLMELKSHQGTLAGRKHYHWYYSQREANDEMMKAPQGLHNFLRAYYYHKSGDCPENASNKPRPLPNWSAETLALLPTYYVMDADKTMPESVTMPTPAEIARETWLADDQLAVYTAEYGRTGFQGGFNWYRIRFTLLNSDLLLFSRRPYAVPFIFVGGDRDWGVWQSPGAVEGMRKLEGFRGMKIVEGAGHWWVLDASDTCFVPILTLHCP